MPRRDHIVETLTRALPELQSQYAVKSLCLFGSVARGDDRDDSDIDLMVTFDPAARVTLFTLSRLLQHLKSLLGENVDLIEDHPGLSSAFRDAIQRDQCRVA